MNRTTTRKSFSRKAIVAVMCVFLLVSMTATGFAAWLISNDAGSSAEGNLGVSNVSDSILEVTINPVTGTIQFGPKETDTTGNVRYDAANVEDKESLSVTVTGEIGKFATLKQMEITITCPDSVLTAAGYTWTESTSGDAKTRTYTYNAAKAYIALPGYATDSVGSFLPKAGDTSNKTAANVIQSNDGIFTDASETNKKNFSITVQFGWGALFEGKNPGRYLDGEDSLTVFSANQTNILNIINDGKEEAEKYTSITAEAKRDILKEMKKTIVGKSTYEEAETADAPKFTLVVKAVAK